MSITAIAVCSRDEGGCGWPLGPYLVPDGAAADAALEPPLPDELRDAVPGGRLCGLRAVVDADEVDGKLRDAVLRGAPVSQALKVGQAATKGPHVGDAAAGSHEQEVVDAVHARGSGLMEAAEDHAPGGGRQFLELRDHEVRLEGVEPRGGLVGHEDPGFPGAAACELAGDGEAALLAAGDPRDHAAARVAPDPRVDAVIEPQARHEGLGLRGDGFLRGL